MSFAVEIIVSDWPDTSPVADTTPTQRLPLLYDTIEDARAAGWALVEQDRAPPGTVTFQIVDEGGDIVVGPSAGSRPAARTILSAERALVGSWPCARQVSMADAVPPEGARGSVPRAVRLGLTRVIAPI